MTTSTIINTDEPSELDIERDMEDTAPAPGPTATLIAAILGDVEKYGQCCVKAAHMEAQPEHDKHAAEALRELEAKLWLRFGGQPEVIQAAGEKWIERWYGSGDERGRWIYQGREPVAFLGTDDVANTAAENIVRAHNASAARAAFRVSVVPMEASNGLTYTVCLDQASRAIDAAPWDDGRLTPINRNDLAEANTEGAEWAEFLGVPFTPCTYIPGVARKNTVPEYGASIVRPPFSKKEVQDLTAMIWGAPVGDEYLTGLMPIIRAFEQLQKTGERPIDPADGGRILQVEGAFPTGDGSDIVVGALPVMSAVEARRQKLGQPTDKATVSFDCGECPSITDGCRGKCMKAAA